VTRANAAIVGVWAALTIGDAAHAATYHVDDSLTLPSNAQTTMKWKSAAPTRADANLVEGAVTVTVRLNLSPWLNRTGQIYMALPPQPAIGQVTAEWTTQGRLLPGRVLSGERTLVYSGPIRVSLLEETMQVRVTANGTRLAMPQRLEFSFEIDVN
jgi:hypothetical protein